MSRYVVFSFDDGRKDFYNNVVPLLKKYNINVTLNVITGFSDKTVHNVDFETCSIDEIKEISMLGNEISIHGDSHMLDETYEDFSKCYNKIKEWTGIVPTGCAMPFTNYPKKDVLSFCKNNNIKYIRIGGNTNKSFVVRVLTYVNRIFNQRLSSIIFAISKTINFMNVEDFLDKDEPKIIKSVGIVQNRGINDYIKLVKRLKNNQVVTFMFHAILKTVDECSRNDYSIGAWTIDQFEMLINYLLDNGYEIITQRFIFDSLCG